MKTETPVKESPIDDDPVASAVRAAFAVTAPVLPRTSNVSRSDQPNGRRTASSYMTEPTLIAEPGTGVIEALRSIPNLLPSPPPPPKAQLPFWASRR